MRNIFRQPGFSSTGIRTILPVTLVLLISCSSHIPPEIEKPPAIELTLEQVQAEPQAYQSQLIRWGGVILETENRADTTWLTVMAKPLDGSGRPKISDQSQGRFIAIVPGFLEPKVYARDREITFSARVNNTETRQIGAFSYIYPVVEATSYYLWLERKAEYPVDPYWYYDPWHSPYYPYYPYFPPRTIR